jgi:hypothetical protein
MGVVINFSNRPTGPSALTPRQGWWLKLILLGCSACLLAAFAVAVHSAQAKPGNGKGKTTTTGTTTTDPSSQGSLVSPQYFGQHLMAKSGLTPQIPVHAMRLWDSGTKWCEMDRGTSSNQYDFSKLDAYLSNASNLGADVTFAFGGTPNWATTGAYPQSSATSQCSTSSWGSPPTDESYWTNFVTALVTHAKGKIHAYELWNEFDNPSFWSGSVDQLVRMSVDAAAIIHRIDPSALVLGPSVDAGGFPVLTQYLSALPTGTIDAVAYHSYTHGACPENSVPAQMSNLRAAIPSAYANLPIWSTEGGWGKNSELTSTACTQKAFVARYDLLQFSQGYARSYWYAYPNSNWGTLWDGTNLTPAGVATRTLDGWLVGATLSPCKSSDGNLWTCDLTTSDGKKAQVVWATTWAVWYSTSGYTTVKNLDGGSSAAPSSIQAGYEPVLLVS